MRQEEIESKKNHRQYIDVCEKSTIVTFFSFLSARSFLEQNKTFFM